MCLQGVGCGGMDWIELDQDRNREGSSLSMKQLIFSAGVRALLKMLIPQPDPNVYY